MVIIVDGDGNVKSVPSSFSQGTALHDVTVVSPFTNSTCVLKIRPVSAEWIDDVLAPATSTADGAGVIFMADIPGVVAELPGRVMYQLEFTSQNGEVKKTNVGSLLVTPSVDTIIPETAEDLSQYSLSQIYSMLAGLNNNVTMFKKSIKNIQRAIPVSIVIPKEYWTAENRASVNVPEVEEKSVVIISYFPDQIYEAVDHEIICVEQKDSVLIFECKDVPKFDLEISAIVFNDQEIVSDGAGGDEEDTEDTPPSITLATPKIALTGDILAITAVDNATAYEVTAGGTLIYDGVSTSLNLRELFESANLTAGTYSIRAVAKNVSASGTVYSDRSNYVAYVYEVSEEQAYIDAPSITLNGDVLTVSPGAGNVYVDKYVLLVDNVIIAYFVGPTINVKTTFDASPRVDYGTLTMTVRAMNTDIGIVSAHSNSVSYNYVAPYINAPTISISGDILTITAPSYSGTTDIVEYQLLIGGEHYGYYEPTVTTIDLSAFGLSNGTYEVSVVSRNDAENVTPQKSNSVTYKVGVAVSLTLIDDSYMGMSVKYLINANIGDYINSGGEYYDGEWITEDSMNLSLYQGDIVILIPQTIASSSVESVSGCSYAERTASDGTGYIQISSFTSSVAEMHIRFS